MRPYCDGPDAAFGVSLDDEAAEVGDGLVDLVDFRCHQATTVRIDGIEGGEMADDLRAGEIDGERHAHAPGTELRRRCGRTRCIISGSRVRRSELTLLTVHAVDPDGGEQAAVVGDAGEVGADVAVVEEDAAACVAAFDGAVEVVPLVYPADGRGGRFSGRR